MMVIPDPYYEEREPMGFEEYLLNTYGIQSNDLTDEDYDRAYEEYQDYLDGRHG